MNPQVAAFLAAFVLLATVVLPPAFASGEEPGASGRSTAQSASGGRGGSPDDDAGGRDGPGQSERAQGGRPSQFPSPGRDRVPDRAYDARERSLEVRQDGRGFASSSAAKDGRDVFSAEYDGESAALRVALRESSGVEHAIQARFDALLEFLDENGNGRYDVGEPVVARYAIRDLALRVEETDSDLGRTVSLVHAIPARGAGAGNGTFSVVVHLVESAGEIDGTEVLPSEAKWDVVVREFPFTREDSLLALGTRVHSDAAMELVEHRGFPSLVSREKSRAGFFSWIPEAVVDGETTQVTWSVHQSLGALGSEEDGHDAVVFFTYSRGEVVIHDPSLGVTSLIDAVAKVLGDPVAYAVGLALGGLMVAGAAFARSRKRE